MFAGVLNKGLRGGLFLCIALVISFLIISLLAIKEPESLFYPDLFYNYFSTKISNKLLIVCLNALLIVVAAYLVYQISIEEELVDKTNIYSLFLFLCINLVCCHSMQIVSQFITNTFYLYSVLKLIGTYRKDNVLSDLFVASFWLSASAFITTLSIIYFPLFFIGWLVLRPFNLKELSTIILGFLTPLFMFECIAYLTDFNQWYFVFATKEFFNSLKYPQMSEYYYAMLILLVLLFLISLVYLLLNGMGNTVKKQKVRGILLWSMFFSLFNLFAGGSNSTSILIILSFPLSVFIGDLLFAIKQKRITNTLIGLLMLSMFLVVLAKLNAL